MQETVGNDRWLHDIVSERIGGKKCRRKDACLDAGAQMHGPGHRVMFPHRNAVEACGYMCIQDIRNGIRPNIRENAALSIGHMMIDRIPSKTKTKLQILNLVSEVFR